MPKASESCFQAAVGLASSYNRHIVHNQCEGGVGSGEQRVHARPLHCALRRITC
jgi:hypothetical protein